MYDHCIIIFLMVALHW